jgi:hypothetical protein
MTTDQRRTPPPSTAHNVNRADVALDPDAALLRRMADGDESALAALYDRWVDRVHTVAYWILKDADEAEDVVDETFWQAWRTAARYDGTRSAASTWLVVGKGEGKRGVLQDVLGDYSTATISASPGPAEPLHPPPRPAVPPGCTAPTPARCRS